ncbi:SDR family NAD(P)-dependent oxidoreductase [Phytohabitans kaempferiae]|uniref:SDR family NAD(P)-dependent oxidoreductase n=1 Tax=Phytohabitans kaempferiae TaxID=1620943 RepID=A0ABV6M464_9ACTN
MTAVVTGASGTIGGAIAQALAGAGHPVVAVGRDVRRLAALRDRVEADGGACATVVADVTEPGEWAAGLADRIAGESRLVLVNAAGVHGALGPVAETPAGEWTRVFGTNLFAAVAAVRALVPRMVAAGWGRVVNVSSAAGVAPAGPFNAPYATSKAALNRFTAHLAAEVAGTGVTAHAIHPGDVVSGMHGEIARMAAAEPRLAGYRAWAEATDAGGTDPEAAGRLVLRLLDDAYAEGHNGWFLWPDGDPRQPFRLT